MNSDIFINFPELETPRIKLAQLLPTDTELIYNFNADPVALEYVARDPFNSFEQAEKKLKEFINAFKNKNGIWWKFILKETGSPIGYGGIFNINQSDNNAEVGYGLLQPFWGKGYMGEIVKSLVHFALYQAKLHRLYAIVLPGNEASVKLLLSNGFKKEGLLRDNAFARGRYFDNLVFGLINPE